MSTNVKPNQLNYDSYSKKKYDRDIVNAIPFHKELHKRIGSILSREYAGRSVNDILDLGVGTGITSALLKSLFPSAKLEVVDFSKNMLDNAKRRLGNENVRYLLGDYSKLKFDKKYDIIVSVIGIHHQTDNGKRQLFRKIFGLLKSDGLFVFGDLVTYRNSKTAALNEALHFHHLVENATDAKTLEEWAYHHKSLNLLAPVENQIKWLKEAGFTVELVFNKFNTALIIARKRSK